MAIPIHGSLLPLRTSFLSVVALCLAPTLGAQQLWTDGVTTIDTAMQTSAVVNSPALPPNSTELFYDSGDFSGSSRNLQNQDIIPGWSYWAHAVRFTPTGVATGQLLEVRYVASSQWGTSLDYDLLIRDAAGLVLGILPNQTAVLDTVNWTVVDVSSLAIDVGTGDFTVEMRPANPCGGDTGFTIAYSLLGSSRSSISADCSDTFVSFLPEARADRPVLERHQSGRWATRHLRQRRPHPESGSRHRLQHHRGRTHRHAFRPRRPLSPDPHPPLVRRCPG
jgi:hypothetical protein